MVNLDIMGNTFVNATARGSIPGRNGVFIELHVLRKGQQMGVPSLNDLAVDGTLNTTNQPTNIRKYSDKQFHIAFSSFRLVSDCSRLMKLSLS